LTALLVAALGGCAAPRAPHGPLEAAAGVVHVRLMHREHALSDALVTALRDPGVASLEERAEARTGADGRAQLRLAPGNWYLSAAAGASGLFGWNGSNPVQVRAGESVDVTIPAVPAPPPAVVAAAARDEEALAGVVVGDGGPVAGAGVTFYLDGTTLFRGPGYLEAQTDERGAFETRVSPGRYWLVARRRSGAQPFGPLEAGDDFGFYPGNPVEVRAGERVTVTIPAVRVLKKSGWSGPSTLRVRVSGTIRDGAGRPLPGYRAFLHANAIMLGKPEFVSEPSGADGAYLIWVDREGTYYLGARAEIGRAREEREAIGLYTGTPDHGLVVRPGAGDLPARDIVVGAGGAP
jgi:hypothetical protein